MVLRFDLYISRIKDDLNILIFVSHAKDLQKKKKSNEKLFKKKKIFIRIMFAHSLSLSHVFVIFFWALWYFYFAQVRIMEVISAQIRT